MSNILDVEAFVRDHQLLVISRPSARSQKVVCAGVEAVAGRQRRDGVEAQFEGECPGDSKYLGC